jgi:transposase
VEHPGVDAASMEVTRRRRRAKTERRDAHKLLTMLRRHGAGEPKVGRVVRGPSAVDEDRRQRPRELLTAKRARTRVLNRRQGLRAGGGRRMALAGEVEAQLEQVRQWDGAPRPAALPARLQRAWPQVGCLSPQSMTREAERREVRRTRAEPVVAQGRQWATLRGIGGKRAWVVVLAFLAWRHWQTPKHVGAFAGLTPPPYQSGEASRALGLTQAGNGSRRTMAVEIAWGWGRFQPRSALTQGSQARCSQGSARLRKLGLVALARQ